MLTRRSSRTRHAPSATPVEVDQRDAARQSVDLESVNTDSVTADSVTTGTAVTVAAATVFSAAASAMPLSRRAARERLKGAQVETEVSTRPVTASEVRRRRAGDEAAEQETPAVLAETFVVTSAPAASEAPAASDATVEATEPAAEDTTVENEPAAESQASASAVADAFAAASRAFNSAVRQATPTSSVQPASSTEPTPDAEPAPETASASDTAHVARRRGRNSTRRAVAFCATASVMGIAGLIAISTTLPAEAIAAAQGAQVQSAMSLVAKAPAVADEASEDEIQAFVAPSDVQNDAIEHTENFSTMSLVDVAAEQGISYSGEVFKNDPDAAIQWPFVVGVGMTWGYGMRDGRLHEGIDFVPGAGAPTQAIADGTVRIATESGGAYGVTVYIDHVIDGEVVTSHYSHLQYGSLQVQAGDEVKVGDVVGLVGNTGRSYGAHLHFELIVNGSTVDPLPWLRENAGRTDK